MTLPRSILETSIAAGLAGFAGAINSSSIDVGAEDDCTFFAPTDDAFAAVGSVFQNASSEDLENLVLYHFINDTTPIYTPRIDHEQWISAPRENVTMSYFEGNQLFINSGRVTRANILVKNGVLHVLDQYVQPDKAAIRQLIVDRVLNPEDAGGDPPSEAVSSPAYPNASPVENIPFAGGAEEVSSSAETVGAGPESVPLGTLSEQSQEDVSAESEGGSGGGNAEEQAANSAQEVQVGSLVAVVGIALVMAAL